MTLTLRWLPPQAVLDFRFAVPQPAALAPIAAIIGPRGPSGPSTIIREAAEIIGGHRVVEVDADNRARLATGARIAGVTTGAVIAGAMTTIQAAGELVEPSWAWAPGPVWMGPLGTLTQVVPVAGPLVEIGIAAGPTSLLINPRLVAQL